MQWRYFKMVVIGVVALVGFGRVALAATCYYKSVDNNALGDNFYKAKICQQWLVNKWWEDFSFDKDDWDDGFGFDDPCNIAQPLARTFNALYLLLFSVSNPALSRNDRNGSFLRWAYNYSADGIDELDGRCGDDDGIRATTWWGGWIFVDYRTELYWPFFYDENVVERAGTIVHEARHAYGKGHDGGEGCKSGVSCDLRWESYGANYYHVMYLAWFRAAAVNTTSAMKDRARDGANYRLVNHFNIYPGFTIS
jgi:hypothetical protein